MAAKAVTDDTFASEVLASEKPIMVDFWAEWCGPCRAVSPILDKIAEENADQLTIAKVNVDDNPELAQRFNVMSIPTMLVFDRGEVSKRIVGSRGKSNLLEELGEFLASTP